MGVCRCGECKLWTFLAEDGVRRPGRVLPPKTIEGHTQARKEKQSLEAIARQTNDDNEEQDDTVRRGIDITTQDTNTPQDATGDPHSRHRADPSLKVRTDNRSRL